MHHVCVLTCQALSLEIKDILMRLDSGIPVESLPAELDMYPSKLRRLLDERLDALTKEFDRVVLAYGRCCPLIDDLVTIRKARRLRGDNCYELLADSEFVQEMRADKATYYLTPFMCRTFERVATNGFGSIRDVKERLAEARSLVYLDTGMDPNLVAKAEEIAQVLDLPLEVHAVGLTNLKNRLLEALDPITESTDRGL